MPTVFVTNGTATAGDTLTFTGELELVANPIGSTVDPGDQLDGATIINAAFPANGTVVFSDGSTLAAADTNGGTADVGIYNLDDGRTIVSFGNPDFGGGTRGFADDIVAYLDANPGVHVTGFEIPADADFNNDQIDEQDDYYFGEYTALTDAVCLARDTLIATDQGDVAVQDLAVGMMVRTRDNGMQPVRWVGMFSARDRAVRIKAGALGNTRDLVVSPRHRMVLDGWQLEMLFDHDHALVTALELVNDDTIVRDEMTDVEYYHVMFDAHEIIFAEGAATESFHPDQPSMGSMDAAAREEIFALFPDLRDGAKRPEAAPNLSATQAAYVGKHLDAFVN